MKIHGVVIEDKEAGVFFGFVHQFPGICAQGNTIQEVKEKVNKYFQAFKDRINEVEMDG